RWLTHPVWEVLDLNNEITMTDLRAIYESLPIEMADLILEKKRSGLFWRKRCDSPISVVMILCDQSNIEGAVALACLWRESLISQQKSLYDAILAAVKLWAKTNHSLPYIQSIATVLIQSDYKVLR